MPIEKMLQLTNPGYQGLSIIQRKRVLLPRRQGKCLAAPPTFVRSALPHHFVALYHFMVPGIAWRYSIALQNLSQPRRFYNMLVVPPGFAWYNRPKVGGTFGCGLPRYVSPGRTRRPPSQRLKVGCDEDMILEKFCLAHGLAGLLDNAIMSSPAPVVQWTEQGTPKALMWVRFPPGALPKQQ